jgi:hypothetical protein
VNARSGMSLNGMADAAGSPGVLLGNTALLDVQVTLKAIRNTGWTDPVTGQDIDGTTYPSIDSKFPADLYSYGGDWFESQSPSQLTIFNPFHWYSLSIPQMAIPGRATTIFEVSLRVDYSFIQGWDEDNEIDDLALVDLADERKAFMARPGTVVLEILTPAT